MSARPNFHTASISWVLISIRHQPSHARQRERGCLVQDHEVVSINVAKKKNPVEKKLCSQVSKVISTYLYSHRTPVLGNDYSLRSVCENTCEPIASGDEASKGFLSWKSNKELGILILPWGKIYFFFFKKRAKNQAIRTIV